jgi:hypothetical protein
MPPFDTFWKPKVQEECPGRALKPDDLAYRDKRTLLSVIVAQADTKRSRTAQQAS